jgi:hypothetical protein
MRYRLRTLLIVLTLAPPIIAAVWSFPAAIILFGWCAIAALSIAELVNCWRENPDRT